jgi:hypothetical protein
VENEDLQEQLDDIADIISLEDEDEDDGEGDDDEDDIGDGEESPDGEFAGTD